MAVWHGFKGYPLKLRQLSGKRNQNYPEISHKHDEPSGHKEGKCERNGIKPREKQGGVRKQSRFFQRCFFDGAIC